MPQHPNIPLKSPGDFLHALEINELIEAINTNATETTSELQTKTEFVELSTSNPKLDGFDSPVYSIGRGLDNSYWVKVGELNADWERILVSENQEFAALIELADAYNYVLGNGVLSTTAGDFTIGDGIKPGGHQIVSNIGHGDEYIVGDFVFEGDANGNGVLVAGPADSAGPLEIPYTWFPVKIDDGLFSGYSSPTSLHIPMSVREIGDLSFKSIGALPIEFGGTHIGDLKIPDSVTKIGDGAFDTVSEVSSLQLSNNLREIGDKAFWSFGRSLFYPELGDVGQLILPDTLESIGTYAFYDGNFSGSLVIPDSVTSIGGAAFSSQNGQFDGTLTLPSNLTSLGTNAFQNCGFTGTLTIPEGFPAAWSTFLGCSGFTGTLTIPEGRTKVDLSEFMGCSGFTALSIPQSVLQLKQACFRDCSGLTGVFHEYTDSYRSIGPLAFSNTGYHTMYFATFSSFGVGYHILKDCLNLKDIYVNSGSSQFESSSYTINGEQMGDNIIGSPVERIHVRPAPHTPDGWTIGPGQTIGGVSNVEVIADWTNWPNPQN